MNSIFRTIVIFLLVGLAAAGVSAQKLTVDGPHATNDLSASIQSRKDRNGQTCALIKVQCALDGLEFSGSVIGDVSHVKGEYWVYMPAGTKQLLINHDKGLVLPIDVYFDGLTASTTYRLTLQVPESLYGLIVNPQQSGNADDGMRYLVLTVEPATATVKIDNTLQDVQNGSVVALLPRGLHSYSVEAAGYATKSATVELTEERQTVSVRLESTLAQLRVECPTQGSQIYVNDTKRGAAPWSGTLAAGNYIVEARLDGHIAQEQSITLAERDNRTISLPALVALTGALNVGYTPLDAEVWIDGKKVGTAPYIFRDIIVGNHTVEIRADGYQSDRRTVTIEKGQTAVLQGTLTRQQSAAAQSAVAQQSGGQVEPFTVKGVSFNMVRVEGGTFQMGSGSDDSEAFDWEKPQHSVTLTKDYYIGETEVTQELWQAVMGKNPSKWKNDPHLPVEQVSYKDCEEFIKKLNKLTNRNFRMPTEAEWEFAARGGNLSKHYKYSGSDTIGDVAWYNGNSDSKTHPVKQKAANELGLYDMTGNVWEWCADWYSGYSSGSKTDPTGPSSGSYRVDRGGSWFILARNCRVAYRGSNSPDNRDDYLGLRLAL